jgi:hypothetical protein
LSKPFERNGARHQWQWFAARLHQRAQVVNSVAMVGVVVSHQHGVDATAFGGEQLLAKIRPAIHEQNLLSALYQD